MYHYLDAAQADVRLLFAVVILDVVREIVVYRRDVSRKPLE